MAMLRAATRRAAVCYMARHASENIIDAIDDMLPIRHACYQFIIIATPPCR